MNTDKNKKIKSSKGGFSLLELSSMLLILAIAVPPMLAVFNYIMRSGAREEAITVSTFLAQGEMEGILSRDFFDMEGLDTKLVFQTCAAAGQPFENYEFLLRTDYINPATGVPPSTFTITSTRDGGGNITGGRTNYIKVTISVRHKRLTPATTTLETIATPTADKKYYQ